MIHPRPNQSKNLLWEVIDLEFLLELLEDAALLGQQRLLSGGVIQPEYRNTTFTYS
jgi:hypothetical protein